MRYRYTAPPNGGWFAAMGLIGESGGGKTWTLERLISLWAQQKIRVIFADFKGSDPKLAERVLAAYLSARPDAGCRVWPAQPLDIWRGGPNEITGRLLMVQDYSEEFYKVAAKTAVRRAVEAEQWPPQDSAEFLGRLDLASLERAYKGTPQALAVSALKMPKIMEGVFLRYAGFFDSLRSRFDHGFSWDDADVSVLTIPTLAEPDDAMAAARVILADFGAYCTNRKPRDERVVLVVDEFSAVTGAAGQVINLAERVRDVGGMIAVSVQNFEGLGRDPDERNRMLDALQPGGLIVHRVGNPGKVLSMAGTTPETDTSWHLNSEGHTGDASVRLKERLSVPWNDVRRLRTGEAFVITHGRALRMNVIPTEVDPVAAARARNLIEHLGVPSC